MSKLRTYHACGGRESLRKLRDTGVVLTDLRATRQSRLFGEAVWRLSPAQGKELPFNRFSQGDSVVVSTKKGCGSHHSPVVVILLHVTLDLASNILIKA